MDVDAAIREAVDAWQDGVWLLDFEGLIRFANPSAGRLVGVPDLTGRSVFDLLPDDDVDAFRSHLRSLRTTGMATSRSQRLIRSDQRPCWVRLRETVHHGSDGEPAGVVHHVGLLRKDDDVREALGITQTQLSEAQRLARMGSWEWDVRANVVQASESLIQLTGVDPSTFPAPYEALLALCHEEDRPQITEAMSRSFSEGGSEFTFMARVHTDGGWRWTRGRGIGSVGENGRVVWVHGTMQDVHDAIETEVALRDQISQNTLMHAVSIAANEGRTLLEVLLQARDLVLVHDDWSTAQAFLVTDAGLESMYPGDRDEPDGSVSYGPTAADFALAERVVEAQHLIWDDERLSMAFPLMHEGEVHAIVVATSDPPLYRHELIEDFSRHVAMQLERVIEREQAALELADARDAAMAASQQKSEFLAVVSHEIRTPLNGVIGLNELLLRSELDESQRRFADGVRQSGRVLLALINDILDFSKAEAGQLRMERVDFDVRAVVDSVRALVAEDLRNKGLTFEARYGPEVPASLRGDPNRLAQILSNLVGNALKFTPTGGIEVEITALRTGEDWVLRCDVSDTGVGIDPDVGDLFEPFRQADASTTRKYGGTGLGLSICRELVSAMDGEISYDSTPGVGSHFCFTARFDVGDELPVVVPPPRPAPRESVPNQRAARILVVEDQPLNQLVAVGMLRALGHHAETADDGLAALNRLDSRNYDLVLMDVQMPRMDGYAATRAIREREGDDERIPIVAMTAAAIDGERERCLAAGMDDFLTKPVELEPLSQTLSLWLSHLSEDPALAASSGSAPSTVTEDEPEQPRNGEFTSPDLDTERLDMLRDMDPDSTEYLTAALSNFRPRSEEMLGLITQAIAANTVSDLRFSAHALAGSAGNLGAVRVAAIAREIEIGADTGRADGVAHQVSSLTTALATAWAELDRYRAAFDL